MTSAATASPFRELDDLVLHLKGLVLVRRLREQRGADAEAFGIRTAMGGGLARRLCPSAIVVSPRMSAYAEASKALYRVFDDTAPLVEGLSIDEAFLDVRGMQRLAGSPTEIAARLR